MLFNIKATDRWAHVSWFFDANPGAFELLKKKWESTDAVSFGELTILDLCQICERGYPERFANVLTVKAFVKVCNSIEFQLNGFYKFLEDTVPPASQAAHSAAAGLLEMGLEESILLTCKSFYNLHSLEDAQKLTIYEYMIARKMQYNEKKFSYNMDMRVSSSL